MVARWKSPAERSQLNKPVQLDLVHPNGHPDGELISRERVPKNIRNVIGRIVSEKVESISGRTIPPARYRMQSEDESSVVFFFQTHLKTPTGEQILEVRVRARKGEHANSPWVVNGTEDELFNHLKQ
jgi:hypothetical protein